MSAHPTIAVVIREIDGEPMMDATGIALMFGITPDEIPVGEPFSRELLQQGRRRAGEAKAHTGQSDFESVLTYWARKDHEAGLRIVDAGGDL